MQTNNTNNTQQLTNEEITKTFGGLSWKFEQTVDKCIQSNKNALANTEKIEVLNILDSKGKKLNMLYNDIMTKLKEFNEAFMQNKKSKKELEAMLGELTKSIETFHTKFLKTKYACNDLNLMMINIYEAIKN